MVPLLSIKNPVPLLRGFPLLNDGLLGLIKTLSTIIFTTFLFLIVSFSVTIYFVGKVAEKKNMQAIVKKNVLNIRSAPTDESSVQFTIHSGTKVIIIDSVENWLNISISDGRKGWAKQKSLIEI